MSMMYTRNLVGLHLKYYTDFHDVDEDNRTINGYGGHYDAKNTVGVMDRNPSSNPTEVYEFVAYKYNNKNSTLITGVEF